MLNIAECPPSTRSLTVVCIGGLCNRLRILFSGMSIAEASGRRFAMVWPRSEHCGATFDELFENPWPVYAEDPAPEVELTIKIGTLTKDRPDFLTSPVQHLKVQSGYWILFPALYPQHAALEPRCVELMQQLTPIAPLRQAVADFQATYFRPNMIGVHLRRGDLTLVRPDKADNTRGVLKAIDRRLAITPDAGILLCSDDGAVSPLGRSTRAEGVHELFRKRYGKRVVWNPPRTLDRSDSRSVQDALIDLWLLRSTDYFIGTDGSSFSDFVYYARDVPHVLIGSTSWRFLLMRTLARVTGLAALARVVVRLRYGKRIPLARAMYMLRNPEQPAGDRSARSKDSR